MNINNERKNCTSRPLVSAGFKGNMNIDILNRVAIDGLSKMFVPKERRYCFRQRLSDDGLISEGVSERYTIISLLGMSRLERRGIKVPVPIEKIIEDMVANAHTIESAGDIGLLIWLCSLVSPVMASGVLLSLDLPSKIYLYEDMRHGKTMELAWLLSGLAHISLQDEGRVSGLDDLANDVAARLLDNYGRGIFGHQSKQMIVGRIRGRIGSFADQVYPIYALSIFSRISGNKKALRVACECADTICRLQGPLGQWWWHYDSTTGKLLGRYPVYSVHQDGMAPMALLALKKASRVDYAEFIEKGMHWLFGNNELEQSLVDSDCDIIWRCIYPGKHRLYCEEMTSFLNLQRNSTHVGLRIKYECRPYHLGWILYAFADYETNAEKAIST